MHPGDQSYEVPVSRNHTFNSPRGAGRVENRSRVGLVDLNRIIGSGSGTGSIDQREEFRGVEEDSG